MKTLIIQTSPYHTASTFLVNAIYGLIPELVNTKIIGIWDEDIESYFDNIIYLTKIKNIFSSFTNKKDLELVSIIYSFLKKDTKTRNKIMKLNLLKDSEDPLIIGNIYLNLLKTKENKIFNGISENFYLQLLENQYLSRNINLK
jgi:hypothetical protein